MISLTAEYALRASVYLAKNGGRRVSRQEIADATGIPSDYLLKVLGILDEARIVQSKRGPGGGYWLVSHPSSTSTLEVLSAVESIPRIDRCPLGVTTHTRLCPLHQLLDDAASRTQEAFRKVTLSDLAQSIQKLPACLFPNLDGSI